MPGPCRYLATLKRFPPVPDFPAASEPGIESVKAATQGLSGLNAHAKHLVQLLDHFLADAELRSTAEGQQKMGQFATEASRTIEQHENALAKGQERVTAAMNWCSRNQATPGACEPCQVLQAMLLRSRQLMIDGITVDQSGHFKDDPGKPGLLELGKVLAEFAKRRP